MDVKNSKVVIETIHKLSQERKASDIASQDSGLKCTRTRVIKPPRRYCEELTFKDIMKIELLEELCFYINIKKTFKTGKMLHDLNLGFLGKI